MTVPRTALFAHLGGPYDGAEMSVEVDEAGVPVELHMVADLTPPNMLINPAAGPQSMPLRAMYERDTDIGEDGVRFVFRFRGQDVLGHAA